MAEKLCELKKKGSDSAINPLYFYCRGQRLAQCQIPIELMKQYKYVCMETNYPYTVPASINIFQVNFYGYITSSSSSLITTIGTTPIEISTLNLDQYNSILFDYNQAGTSFYQYCIKLYN